LTAQNGEVKAQEIYFTRDMQNHHGGVVLVNGYLYGFSSSILTCLEFTTGKLMWRNRSEGKGLADLRRRQPLPTRRRQRCLSQAESGDEAMSDLLKQIEAAAIDDSTLNFDASAKVLSFSGSVGPQRPENAG
jgi:hypothetical protein